MTVATLIDDVRCTVCKGYGVFVDIREERSQVLVSARCYSCDHDYGVIGGAPRAVEVTDDLWDAGEALAREVLG